MLLTIQHWLSMQLSSWCWLWRSLGVKLKSGRVTRDLAKKGVGRVFATDALITGLMCATRSVYSWDVIVERRGDFLFFDKRDGSNLDMLTGAARCIPSLMLSQGARHRSDVQHKWPIVPCRPLT